MLLNAVIIVLREVLEAALLISILSAMSVLLGVGRRWTGWSLAAGLAGALLLGYSIDTVSGWFGGVGQEVVSAALQIAIYLLLGLFIVLMQSHEHRAGNRDFLLTPVMAGAVAIAVAREGFEILVYVYGFALDLHQLMSVLAGMAIGTGIGISAGALIYYLLIGLRRRWSRAGGAGLLILVAAGMASQAALLLIQADWLPSQLPLWDSSAFIAEDSVGGQLLYALLGYEATPTAIQAGCYFGGGLLLLLLALVTPWFVRRRVQAHET